MTVLSVAINVSTATTPINLNDGTNYKVVAFAPPGRTWRRYTVEGRYQHGRAAIGEVLNTENLSITVKVKGSTWVAAAAAAVALRDALSQHTYTITSVIEGVTEVFTCEPANFTIIGADGLDKNRIARKEHLYLIEAPYNPTAA